MSARCSNLAAWSGRAGTDHSWCDLRKTGFYGVMRTGLCSWDFIFKIYQRVENRRLLHSGSNFPAAVFFLRRNQCYVRKRKNHGIQFERDLLSVGQLFRKPDGRCLRGSWV